MDERDIRRAARISGMRGDALPSLEQVERRRFELWLMSTVLLVGLTASLGLLTMWSPDDMHALLIRPGVRFGVVGLALAMSLYSVEKERSLRRIARLLFDERLLTTALSSRLHEISTLLDAGRAVNSTLDLDRVLASILQGATDLMPASSGSVMLLDGHELVVAAAVGNSSALGRRAAIGDGIAGHVARTLQPLLINGHATPALFPGLPDRSSHVGSALCVPLVEREELLGVLNLSSASEGEFSEYDLRAVSLFAEQAAAAISKARLYAQSRQQAADLAHAATHDSLTGLGNRTALQQRTKGDEALLFIDLDGFKEVNDMFGHAAGDEVLVTVARRITQHVSTADLVVRFGGDEFAILLHGVRDEVTAASIADRVRTSIDGPIAVAHTSVRVTASIGVAVPGPQGASLDSLLRDADRALYAAKDSGKACTRVSGRYDVPRPRAVTALPIGS